MNPKFTWHDCAAEVQRARSRVGYFMLYSVIADEATTKMRLA